MKSDSQILIEVVRGERPVGELGTAGVVVRALPDGRLRVTNPRGARAVATARDVAIGLIQLRAQGSAVVSEWAKYVLDVAVPVDLAFSESEDEDQLLSGLWDAAFGAPLDDQLWSIAERLAN